MTLETNDALAIRIIMAEIMYYQSRCLLALLSTFWLYMYIYVNHLRPIFLSFPLPGWAGILTTILLN